MNRQQFLLALAALPMTTSLKLNSLKKITDTLQATEKMPVLFLGHGSPMNAIQDNEFVKGWKAIGKTLPEPKAILVVSAHWETKGTFVTAMENPRTIHDFGGFPQELFDVQYPAPGSPEFAAETKRVITSAEVGLDEQWGLDHGTWSVVKNLYPNANIPVFQLSLDYRKPPAYHYTLAKELTSLRNKGVLIIGSGNMVHNLRKVAWDKLDADNYGFEWALQAREKMNTFIQERNHEALVNFKKQGKAFDLAIPTEEHFLPLLYTLALQGKKEEIELFNDKAVGGSLTMTSVKIG